MRSQLHTKSFADTICIMDMLDGELRQRAARYREETKGEILSKIQLRQLTRMLEPDLAAMIFYESILYSKFDSEFINLVNSTKLNEASQSEASRLANRNIEIAIVPSTYSASNLKWGIEAEEIQAAARQLGFRTEILDTLPTNSLNENALIIGEYLRGCTAESVILVSRNRGSSEVRLLLQERGAEAREFRILKSWISITGVVNGSMFLENQILERESLRGKISQALESFRLRLVGESPIAIEQSYSSYSIWQKDFRLPPATTLIQILGIPRVQHLPPLIAHRAKALLPVGPNDGFLFLEECWLQQGLRYPMWGLHSASAYKDYKNVLDRVLVNVLKGQKFLKELT